LQTLALRQQRRLTVAASKFGIPRLRPTTSTEEAEPVLVETSLETPLIDPLKWRIGDSNP
jgi:hypothetical protein